MSTTLQSLWLSHLTGMKLMRHSSTSYYVKKNLTHESFREGRAPQYWVLIAEDQNLRKGRLTMPRVRMKMGFGHWWDSFFEAALTELRDTYPSGFNAPYDWLYNWSGRRRRYAAHFFQRFRYATKAWHIRFGACYSHAVVFTYHSHNQWQNSGLKHYCIYFEIWNLCCLQVNITSISSGLGAPDEVKRPLAKAVESWQWLLGILTLMLKLRQTCWIEPYYFIAEK